MQPVNFGMAYFYTQRQSRSSRLERILYQVQKKIGINATCPPSFQLDTVPQASTRNIQNASRYTTTATQLQNSNGILNGSTGVIYTFSQVLKFKGIIGNQYNFQNLTQSSTPRRIITKILQPLGPSQKLGLLTRWRLDRDVQSDL
jgi:hypothetical protein